MTKPIVASVSEPSKPEPFIESYAIQMRGETDVEGYYASRKSAERDLAEDYAPGAARLVIIPGDDAPPATANGWRPASEPPKAQMRNVLVLCAGKDPSCAYINDGMWWESLSRLRLYNVTHWRELPEPPK